MDADSSELVNETQLPEPVAKKKKPGIIYLSTLPPFMNVTKTKEIFSGYGEIGRLFLQPARPDTGKSKSKPSIHFTEGWVEFKSKRIAREVAENLNNSQIGGKKKSKFYDYTWNIKYLPRFKWVHLSERLTYERMVRKQKLRVEIAQAKREANFYSANLEKSVKSKKKKKKNDDDKEELVNNYSIRETNEEIVAKKKKPSKENSRADFLKSIFGKK